MKYCKYCNEQLNDSAAYCSSCGAKLDKEKASESSNNRSFDGGSIIGTLIGASIISSLLRPRHHHHHRPMFGPRPFHGPHHGGFGPHHH